MKAFKSLFLLNKEDFLVYLTVLLAPFLLLHLIMFGVMAITKAETTILIGGFILVFLLTAVAFLSGYAHASLSFTQYVTFGCSRIRALGLTLAVAVAQTLCSTALALVLAALEQNFTLSLCSRLSGRPVYMEVYLPVEWWVYLLAALGGLALGVIAAAIISRFGRTGGVVLYVLFMAACFSPQFLPWEKYTITDWLFPLLIILVVVGLIWSIYSMLHSSIR